MRSPGVMPLRPAEPGERVVDGAAPGEQRRHRDGRAASPTARARAQPTSLETTCSCLLSSAVRPFPVTSTASLTNARELLDHARSARLGVVAVSRAYRRDSVDVAWALVLPRRRHRRAAASRCAAGVSGRARRRLGRSRQALHPRPAVPPAAGRRPEAVAEALGARPDELSSPPAAPTPCTPPCSVPGGPRRRTSWCTRAIEHSAVMHAAAGTSRAAGAGVDLTGRLDLDAWRRRWTRPGWPSPRSRANHEVGTVQPVDGRRRRRARAGVPLLVDAAQSIGRSRCRGLVAAHRQRPQVGRPARRRRPGGPQGHPLGASRGRARRSTSRPWSPPPRRCGAVHADGRGAEAARLSALVDQIRATVAADRARRRGGRRPRRPAPPPRDLLLPLRRRRGPAARPGPARVRGSSGSACTPTPSGPRTCWRRWACSPTATSGFRSTGSPPTDVQRFLAELPGLVAERPSRGGGCDALPWSSTALGRRCPLPVIMLASSPPVSPPGTRIEVLADDPAAAIDIPAWCRMRGHTFVSTDAPSHGGASVGATSAPQARQRQSRRAGSA